MPAARAPSTSSAGVSPTWSASPAAQPRARERRFEDRRVGLRRADLGRRNDRVQVALETAMLENLRQRDVPVRDADELDTA